MTTIELIKSDLFRYAANTTLKSFFIHFLTNPGFIFMFWFRLSQSKHKFVRMIAYPICFLKNRKYQIHMNPKSVKVGYGFYIGHGGPFIVHPTVKIGNNCNVAQFTTIGSVTGQAASIGDNVWIGPNVIITGAITVGSGSVIGAGSIVLDDVAPNTTIAGHKARIIKNSSNLSILGSIYIPHQNY